MSDDADVSTAVGTVVKDAEAGMSFGPIGALLGGAAGLIGHYAPMLFSGLFSSSAAAAAPVAKAAAAAVSAVTGESDPVKQLAKVQGDPNVALELQVQLGALQVQLEQAKAEEEKAQLAATHQAAQDAIAQMTAAAKADHSNYVSQLNDVQGARQSDLAYLAAGKTNVRANVMVIGAAIGLVGCLVAGVAMEILIKNDSQASGLIIGLIVSVAGIFGNALLSAYNFEFGSSRSSADSQNQVSQLTSQFMAHNATTVPISALGALPSQGGGNGAGS